MCATLRSSRPNLKMTVALACWLPWQPLYLTFVAESDIATNHVPGAQMFRKRDFRAYQQPGGNKLIYKWMQSQQVVDLIACLNLYPFRPSSSTISRPLPLINSATTCFIPPDISLLLDTTHPRWQYKHSTIRVDHDRTSRAWTNQKLVTPTM